MIKVQRVRILAASFGMNNSSAERSCSDKVTWVVLGDDYLPIEPIEQFLSYLRSTEKSPNTIRSYAHHLKHYFQFLQAFNIEWAKATTEVLADFISWLRKPDSKVICIHGEEPRRLESTVNVIVTVVCGFYEYHERLGNADSVNAYKLQSQFGKRYKSFLHHINKGKDTRIRVLKLKQPKTLPKVFVYDQARQLINACNRIRDKFLVCLLHETGMRIGQALGLRHEDIRSWDNEIQIVPRDDNVNGARAKTRETYTIHVSKELMTLYSEYITIEYPETVDSDYLFVNIWEGKIGYPMTYSTVQALFRRLSKHTGVQAMPHMFRHTHATELIRNGMEMSYVQKRLGHASIQTTIDTYTHLTLDDLKEAYQSYLEERLNDRTKL